MSPEELFFKMTKIQRILIVVAVSILLLVGFYFLFISDMLLAINGLEKQIGSLKTDIKNQESIFAGGPKLKARITALRTELQAMVSSLPEKQDIEELLKKITDLLSESNLMTSQFLPGKEVVHEELYYATIPIQLTVRGEYQKQGSFLTSLNTLPRVVNVPSIVLTKTGGGSSRESDLLKKLEVVNLNAKINGVTFRRLSPEEIKKISEKKKGAKASPARRGGKRKSGGPPKMGP